MRPTWAEISIESLRLNFNQVKRIVGEAVSVMSVVKADAYGHGAVQVSKALIEAGTEMLGVATLEEALQLRESGIAKGIFILGGIQPDEAETAIKAGLTPSLSSIASAQALNNAAEKIGRKAKYHLEVDTGMRRLGIGAEEICEFLRETANCRSIEMEGIFTHFSSADTNDRASTLRQISQFSTVLAVLKQAGLRLRYIHMANSAGIQRFPESHKDLVRPGIMLYGSGKVANYELKPVMKLMTRIVQLKNIPAGTPVSYGETFVAARQSVIAVLPIGYADGYNRLLSNRAMVSVKRKAVPVTGRVCMDLIMIDVTDVPGIKTGDEVTLFGDDVVHIDDVAGWAETISYEILSLIGKRVPRVYV